MSFSFNFSGDDISDSELEQTASQLNKTKISQIEPIPPNRTHAVIPPKRHSLISLLETVPSQLSYNYLDVPILQKTSYSNQNGLLSSTTKIPRRSIFDIRQQLMAESDPTSSSDTTNTLLSGLATGDLSTGFYEGGFKTWECAVDLAGYVAVAESNSIKGSADDQGVHVIELGAGSAIPSLVLLRDALLQSQRGGHTYSNQGNSHRSSSRRMPSIKFTICDYNEDVLRLCTAANIYLTTLFVTNPEQFNELSDSEDVEVNESSLRTCLNVLEDAGIKIDFVSGAWSSDFTTIVNQGYTKDGEDTSMDDTNPNRMKALILASETIYSPDSLSAFTQTISDLAALSTDDSRVLVAAKKVYFGVGGGVAEFEEELRSLGGKSKVVYNVDGAGVGRVILDVTV